MKNIHGNKTYATAALAIAAAWIAYFFKVDLGEGMVSLEDALTVTIAGLAMAFLRHGVKNGAGGAAMLLVAAISIPGCSLLEPHDGSERAAKLRYADALQGLAATKRTTMRLFESDVISAEDVVRIDAIVKIADARLETAWDRIVAGDYSAQTFEILDFVLEAVEQIAAMTLQMQQENADGRQTSDADCDQRPGHHRLYACFGGAGESGWGNELRAA